MLFNLKLPDIEIKLPYKHTTTNEDVYKYAQKYTKDNLILYYRNTPIPRHNIINLIEIGYDPYHYLHMLPLKSAICTFTIPKHNFSFTKEIFSYQTIFDVKAIFAKEFYTVAQNVVIKKWSQILSDDLIILDNGYIFEVDVIEGFSLHYVLFGNFLFICLPNNSTFNDLKIILAGYKNLNVNGIMFGHINFCMSDEKIKDYSSKVQFFDFKSITLNNPPTTIINVYIETSSDEIRVYNGGYPCHSFDKGPTKSLIDSIKCLIEKTAHINKDVLILADDLKHISRNTLTFYSLKYIYVTIDNKPQKFPYLITIKELREKYSSKDSSIGFIINGHFAYKETDFLAKYLGNSVNDEKTPMQICIIRPENKCRLCQIQSGKDMKVRSMIIPTFYTFDDITKRYFGKPSNSMTFFSGFYSSGAESNPIKNTDRIEDFNSNTFYACLTKDLTIKYRFYDSKEEYEISMSNEGSPQIKNFIFEIYKKHNKNFHTYDVYIKDKRIYFWEYLVEYIGEIFILKTYENKNFIKIYDETINVTVKYIFEKNDIKTTHIIKDVSTTADINNVSLYMNFHKLCPDDLPLLLYQPYDFLILGSNDKEKMISVTNKYGINETKRITFENNRLLSAEIISDFNLTDKDFRFILKLDSEASIKQKEFILPPDFDSGSIPDKSVIVIEYQAHETDQYTFIYDIDENEQIKANIKLYNPNSPIKMQLKEIIKKMKIFNNSPKAVDFEFLGNKLDQDKTFSSYGIIQNSMIKITHKKDAIKVSIFLFNETNIGYYYFEKGTKVKEVIGQLRLVYGLEDDVRLEIYSQPNKRSHIDLNNSIEDGDKFYASFEKVKIRLFDPKGERIEIDEIIKPTKEFISNEIVPKIKDGSEITTSNLALYKQESAGHYVVIDSTKSFKENDCNLYFAFRRISDIEFFFGDDIITLSDINKISEQETISSIIKHYISSAILAPPNSIKLAINRIDVNQNETIGKLLSKGRKIEIKFEKIDDLNGHVSKKSTKPKISLSRFKPKIVASKLQDFNEKKTEKVEVKKKKSVSQMKSDSSSEPEEKKLNDDDDDDEIKSENETPEKTFFIDNEDEKHHKFIERIGGGATSFTYKIFDEITKQYMCKKVIKYSCAIDIKTIQDALKEFEVMHKINHPCICKAIGINTQEPIRDDMNKETTTIAIFLEYLDHKLSTYLHENKANNTMKTKIVVEISHGMLHIHHLDLIHRDLKIENILLNTNYEAKIADFGLVKINESFNNENSLTRGVGTPSYMAPEMVFEDEVYDNKIDVYSFGVVLYYMFIGELPKQSKREKLSGVPIHLPEPSDSASEVCLNLIKKCMSYNKEDRPSFDQILDFMRSNSYSLASGVDIEIVKKRDFELTSFENSK